MKYTYFDLINFAWNMEREDGDITIEFSDKFNEALIHLYWQGATVPL